MKFFNTLKSYFTNKEIIQRILFTLLVLFIFRLLSKVPVPGVESNALQDLFGAQNSNTGALFNIANVLAGGTLTQFSIISVGLFAFISASVIFQLLGPIVPKIDQLQKMGETGRKIIDQWTRILTVPLAAIQAFGIYLVLQSSNNAAGRPLVEDLSNYRIATLMFVLVAGTMLLIWIAELCSEKGLGGKRGGGISVIITAGILASLPTSLVNAFSNFTTVDYQRNFWIAFGAEWLVFAAAFLLVWTLYRLGKIVVRATNSRLKTVYAVLYTILLISVPTFVGLAARAEYEWARQVRTLWEVNIARLDTIETRFGFFLAMTFQIIAITIFFNESVRRIPIKFIARIRTRSGKAMEDISYLPIKLLAAGVMPIIFASSFLLMPAVINRFFGEAIANWDGIVRWFGGEGFRLLPEGWVDSFSRVLSYAANGWLDQFNSPYYHVLHFILTVLFSLFFITIVMKAEDIANDLKGRKTFIPGVRPGDETINYLSSTILKVTFWGGIVLASISVLPYLLGLYSTTIPLGIESFLAGGTSVLIVVPTMLAVKAQIDALVLTKNYEQFEEI